METLRCPKCLNRLVDGGSRRCPECGTRVRSLRRAAAAADAIASRPRALVERELQARIEAQTASGFRQRRRAAKTARRIAALPPSLFEAGAMIITGRGSWNATSTTNPAVIDLPVTAIHDVPPIRVASEAARVSEPEPVVPEPLALVAPVIEMRPADPVTPEPERETEATPTETTPTGPPNRAHRRRTVRIEHRWRLRRRPAAAAPKAGTTPVAESVEPVEVPRAQPVAADVVPELAVFADPEPQLEPVVVAEPEPEPEPNVAEPEPEPNVAEPEPDPERIVAREPKRSKPTWEPASIAPRDAAAWQPSTSLWARQVFQSRIQAQPAVAWPRPYAPPSRDDRTRDQPDADGAESSRAD